MSSADFIYKLLFIGEASVGKTTLVNRYIRSIYIPDSRLTIGVDFYSKKVKLPNGKKLNYRYGISVAKNVTFLLPVYSKKANAAFYLFDLTQKQTLDNIEHWLNIFMKSLEKYRYF